MTIFVPLTAISDGLPHVLSRLPGPARFLPPALPGAPSAFSSPEPEQAHGASLCSEGGAVCFSVLLNEAQLIRVSAFRPSA